MSTRKLETFRVKRKASIEGAVAVARSDKQRAAPALLENSVPYLIGLIGNRLAAHASAALRRGFGIGFPEWRIIVVLAEEPGAAANRICQLIGMDKAAASRGLRDLEEQGLIQATRETAQSRSRGYVLTRDARRLHAQYAPVARKSLEALMGDLSVAERALLVSMLRRIRDRSNDEIGDP